jgi:hypothetical protein
MPVAIRSTPIWNQKKRIATMNPFRMLIIALMPLLIANVLLWALYAHSVVASIGWGVTTILSMKLADWSDA